MSSIGTGPVDQTPSKDPASTEVEALPPFGEDVAPSVPFEESHDADPTNTTTASATGPMAPRNGPGILTSSIMDRAQVAVESRPGNAVGGPGLGAREAAFVLHPLDPRMRLHVHVGVDRPDVGRHAVTHAGYRSLELLIG